MKKMSSSQPGKRPAKEKFDISGRYLMPAVAPASVSRRRRPRQRRRRPALAVAARRPLEALALRGLPRRGHHAAEDAALLDEPVAIRRDWVADDRQRGSLGRPRIAHVATLAKPTVSVQARVCSGRLCRT